MFGKKKYHSERVFFETYYNTVYKLAYFISRDEELAQDAAQETFIKIFNNIEKLEMIEKIEPWIKTITRRATIDCLRKRKRWNDFTADSVLLENGNGELESGVEQELINQTTKEEIALMMDQLKPEYRTVLYLKYMDEKTDDEIAKELNEKVGTVKSRIHRAKALLAKKMNNGGDWDE